VAEGDRFRLETVEASRVPTDVLAVNRLLYGSFRGKGFARHTKLTAQRAVSSGCVRLACGASFAPLCVAMAKDADGRSQADERERDAAATELFDADRIAAHRRETDDSLRAERAAVDDVVGDRDTSERADRVVSETSNEAEERLRAAREHVDKDREEQLEKLPQLSEKLEEVAETLSKAAASLDGVADALKENPVAHEDSPAREQTSQEPVQIAENIAEVAQALEDTADDSEEVSKSPGRLAEQLAQIASGMADVTATLAEERRDADENLTKEREITDHVVRRGMEHVGSELAQELREERRLFGRERQATDKDLAEERRHTDEAVDHVLAILTDEQRAHHAAERRVATRNEFLSIVSHDLRAPLTAISGAADLIHVRAPHDAPGDEIRAWADVIRRSVAAMSRLISDLLDFRSFEDGRLRVAAERHDLKKLVRNAIQAFRVAAAAKPLSLDADLPPGAAMAKFDPDRMLQVLSNLLDNALKFTPPGGSIRVRVERSGPGYIVSVSDTGIGIPKAALSSIFERFEQLDADRSGLGLGLYISSWIVEAHGGRMWAESEVGRGSTFYLTLPEK
jgi:signal transduction histidine kinase